MLIRVSFVRVTIIEKEKEEDALTQIQCSICPPH